jgi:hypothetical protein
MSEKKPDGESIGIFLGSRSPIAVPLKPLRVGPGEPGPGDEWRLPTGPLETEDDVSLEPVHPHDVVALPHRPTAEK